MSDEKFFSQVKSSMESYTPEAPAEVYAGMRKKLWWSGFTKLSATRFNMWYLILLLGIGGGAFAYSNTCEAPASTVKAEPLAPAVAPTNTTVAPAPVAEQPQETTPAVIETATPATENTAVIANKETTAAPKAGNTKAETPKKKEVTPVVVDTPTAEVEVAPQPNVAAQQEDTIKEESPKKKRKKLTLDIYTSDKDKDAGTGEN